MLNPTLSTQDAETRGKHFEVTRTLKNEYSAEEFELFPRGSHARVLELCGKLEPALAEWCERYPAIAPSRLQSTALVGAVAAIPGSTFEQNVLLTKVGLITFAIDDIADGEIGELTDDESLGMVDRYLLTVESPDSESWDAARGEAECIGAALQELTRELMAAEGAVRFGWLWREHFQRMISGHQVELRTKRLYQTHRTLPAFEEYLQAGQWTISLPMWAAAVLMVINPQVEHDLSEDPLIEDILRELGLLVRWTNDIRSFDREYREGKFNGLTLLMRRGMSEAEAEREAVNRSSRHLRKLESLTAMLPSSLEEWGKSVVRTGRFCRNVYLKQEFHHWNS
ncbi:terpene synthase family protein [Vitiosangium sp. GDMCC 1.1324]|uniref:terpene synthase family protein n=1 Tax=Vitiosangium sp. (strain GDMCC 1.1324) TaxID=2138576 RepID=UPI00130E0834|nr:terpene synthase family protein [Vitiosangium sp. GDMCC 1.1324]